MNPYFNTRTHSVYHRWESAPHWDGRSYKAMVRPEERRKRGTDLMKKCRYSGPDKYAAASDAIADILLSVAENTEEASQILRSAEEDFRCAVDEEGFVAEG